jgi:hypothetical protein
VGEFVEVVENARACAVLLSDLSCPRASDLVRLKQERPLLPLVLVTDLNATNARKLQRLPPVEETLFIDEIQGYRLGAALAQAAQHSLLKRAIVVIDAVRHLSPELRATLARACNLLTPVRSVHRLAHGIMGYSESELRKHWRADAQPGTKVHDFIDWLLVAHASIEWRVWTSPTLVARHLGVDPRTLAAALHRRFGEVSLPGLVADPEIIVDNLAKMLAND